MNCIEAPNPLELPENNISIFLGGSIEMGKAENWQQKTLNHFKNYKNVTFINPRRQDWTSSWSQDPIPNTPFYDQVQWELKAQFDSHFNIYYFDPTTTSPITLLELGLFINKTPLIYCPQNYFRYGNVQITANYFNIPVLTDFDDYISSLKLLCMNYK